MQTNLEKLQENKFLIFCLMITGLALLGTTVIGKDTVMATSDFTTILAAGALAVLSIILSVKFGIRGHHGKAWLLFSGMAISWFAAEIVWAIYDLVFHQDPFPSTADLFYIVGYPLLFLFALNYLKPFKKLISKKMVMSSSLLAILVLIPNLYMTLENNSDEDKFSIALGATYPIMDSIVLVPAILGIALFVRGEVNFLWTLLLIGILFEVIADTGFQFFTLDNSYYSGHPVDILFIWSYIVYSFGIYNHIKIFKKEPQIKQHAKPFDNQNLK